METERQDAIAYAQDEAKKAADELKRKKAEHAWDDFEDRRDDFIDYEYYKQEEAEDGKLLGAITTATFVAALDEGEPQNASQKRKIITMTNKEMSDYDKPLLASLDEIKAALTLQTSEADKEKTEEIEEDIVR